MYNGRLQQHRGKKDRSWCIYNDRDTYNFNSFLEETRLLELEGVRYSFTWFGPKDKKSKLDRVIVNDGWLSSY